VLLRTIGQSLERWEGPAKVLLGSFFHLGEFAKTRQFAGRGIKGLRITLEPIELLKGPPQRFFTNGRALLEAIDWRVLEALPAHRPDRPATPPARHHTERRRRT
jgi:hypothetical protein